VPRPVIYYVRHGLTDWNVEQRLQGRHDIALNKHGRAQALECGEILGTLFATRSLRANEFAYVSSPLMRARETMELMRSALGLDPKQYEVDERLVEIAFGEWEGLTYTDVIRRDREVVARREADKWGFLPPAGESYAQVAIRIGEWADSLTKDTVVAAHGGTARALIAHFAIAPAQDATHYSIDQGVVYVFADGKMIRYS
jgi:broad specificity phosphatase PhoE